MALDYLFNGQAPQNINATTVSQNGLPDWYQEYLRGVAGQGVNIAGQNSSNPIPQMSVAGLTPDQEQAAQGVRNNQGAWQPWLGQAGSALQGASGQANDLVNQAQTAVAGAPQSGPGSYAQYTPYTTAGIGELAAPQSFPANYSQYMSPHTMGVVNEIGRLGNQNFSENIMPQVNASMIGSGQFGSTRNADVLARAGRDAQQNILGQQANALETGYSTAGTLFNQDANRLQQQQQARAGLLQTGATQAGNLFNQDANRAQQQQQYQSSAALQGAQIGSNAATGAAGALSALGQNYSSLGLADSQALGAIGSQQQALQQGALDTAFNNQTSAQNYDWSQLNNLNSILRGLQLPTTQTQVTNAPLAGSKYTSSPLEQVGQIYGWMQGRK
jgi:hypothetical protein